MLRAGCESGPPLSVSDGPELFRLGGRIPVFPVAGPGSANMTSGTQYLVWVWCADLAGGTTTETVTVTKA